MNPTGKDRNAYLAVNFAFAVAYAFLVGGLPAEACLTDGVTYCVLITLFGIALWNIFHYAVPDESRLLLYQRIFVILLVALATLCITGLEMLVLYACYPSAFGEILTSVPLRIFITLLWFALQRLYYLSPAGKEEAAAPSAPPPALPVPAAPIERITVRNGQKIKIIALNEILYLQADGDYVSIHTAEGHWLKEQTMKYSEEILPADRFIRIHRSYIVNITHISRIERYGEQQSLILHNGERIRISAARYQLLRQRLAI